MSNPKKEIQLQLTVDEINTILTGLGQMPYVQVASIIGSISKQAELQLKESEEMKNKVMETQKLNNG